MLAWKKAVGLVKRIGWLAARAVTVFAFILAFRLRAFGTAHVPRRGGVLLASNHQSYLDPIILTLGPSRSMSFMARRSLFRNRLFGALIRFFNAFPVTREGVDMEALREAILRLQAGACLIVFPEGTRTRDGEIGPFRPGVMTLAERAGVPVAPVVIEGAFQVWSRHGGIRSGRIGVLYGRPMRLNGKGREAREDLARRLREEMLRLQAELRRRMARASEMPMDGCLRPSAISVRESV